MIRVGNIKLGDRGIYIGRTGYGMKGSPLQNPFKLTGSETRTKTIQRYRTYILAQIAAKNPEILAELARIKAEAEKDDVVLLCWCAPAECHGHVIKEIVENMIRGAA